MIKTFHRLRYPRLLVMFSFLLSVLLVSTSPAFGQTPAFKVLIFSRTLGFRHTSIGPGITAIQALGTQNNFAVDATEDPTKFTDANLAQYQAIIFLNTTGDVITGTQQTALQNFIAAGKGYVGIHAASDTLHTWTWYGNLVGAWFTDHPGQLGTNTDMLVEDHAFPGTTALPARWSRNEELYNFDRNPRGTVHVLTTYNESQYTGGTMGFDHPSSWCQQYGGGRSWYTAMGHNDSSFSEAQFQTFLLGGIKWAAGNAAGDCGASLDKNYQKVTLVNGANNPMQLDIAADGRVFYIERSGGVKIFKPATSTLVTAGTIPTETNIENGLLGFALDPNFATNGWLYAYYSPAPSSPAIDRLSRFHVTGDTLELSSEVVMLNIPTQRTNCCHSGGGVEFGNNGNLFIGVGDNTDPFDASNGYAPIDERAGQSDWDAQKSASNTNDLRGKILRIHPETNGTYTIPSGNLFPGGSGGKAEIFTMGHRNPFRFSIDSANGWMYFGQVGPDASADSALQGPMGYDQWTQVRTAGNYGWPYCIGNNRAYRDYNFATQTSTTSFNCNAPINNSPNNTGPQAIPAARPATIWYPYSHAVDWPQIDDGSGRTAMSGPVYHFNAANPSTTKLPQYYDKTWFIYEWSRNFFKEVKLDDSGNILAIQPFLKTFTFIRPMDVKIGPNGSMYVINWGTGFGGANADASIVRIDYVGAGNLNPVAVASSNKTNGSVPLAVNFSSAGSADPGGSPLTYKWDFTNDGTVDSTAANPSFTYSTAGNFTAKLTVTNNTGKTGTATVIITAGNNAPVVTISQPPSGGFFNFGDSYTYTASVTDTEDGSTPSGISCSNVAIQPGIGHADHIHAGIQQNACTGTITTPASSGHTPADKIVYLTNVAYTDRGNGAAGALTGRNVSILRQHQIEAAFFDSFNDVKTEATSDPGGYQDVGTINNGSWIAFNPVNFFHITGLTFRVASAGPGGTIETRLDSPTGTLVATATVPVTGGWQTWTNVTVPMTDPGGSHNVYFVFKGGAGNLFNVEYITANGQGVGTSGGPTPTPVPTTQPTFIPPTNTPVAGGNVVQNPSFETAGSGGAATAANWTLGTNHTRASDKFHSGGWSLKSTFTGAGTSTNQTVSVTPNTSYTYSGWVWKDSTTGGGCMDMNDIAGETQLCPGSTGSWQFLSGTWNSGSNTSVTLRLISDGTPNGNIWFDDISLTSTSSPTQIPPTPTHTGVVSINSGGPAVAPYVADKFFDVGNTDTVTNTIDTTGVTNPAPMSVYQSERWNSANFTYSITGLTANSSYTVILHFAETYVSAAAQRLFNVDINGTRVLTNFDVFAAAGAKFKAITRQYTATADSTGKITILFSKGTIENPKISGIEIK